MREHSNGFNCFLRQRNYRVSMCFCYRLALPRSSHIHRSGELFCALSPPLHLWPSFEMFIVRPKRNYHIITLKSTVPWMERTYRVCCESIRIYAIVCTRPASRNSRMYSLYTHDECWMIPHIYNGTNVTVQFGCILRSVFTADHVNWAEVLKLFCCVYSLLATRTMTYGNRCAHVCV